MQIVTWPFRKFFSYICKKLLSDYLEPGSYFRKFEYSDGALCLHDIALNPPVFFFLTRQKINESLKDIPYKVLSANIQNMRILVPRYFLSESIKVVISEVMAGVRT
eukprot:TRINITY_DN14805_c0_g1_i2.p3 TRINITY_DN14805_c0_g1~~TRINITY_DN14805_c0_g1_i2.p3  ORF type:complete len:106 (-),score=21.28 TRINITY_DN14805_c0_g1_i2:471-788(-)